MPKKSEKTEQDAKSIAKVSSDLFHHAKVMYPHATAAANAICQVLVRVRHFPECVSMRYSDLTSFISSSNAPNISAGAENG